MHMGSWLEAGLADGHYARDDWARTPRLFGLGGVSWASGWVEGELILVAKAGTGWCYRWSHWVRAGASMAAEQD